MDRSREIEEMRDRSRRRFGAERELDSIDQKINFDQSNTN